MDISRQVILDVAHVELLDFIKKMQKARGLTACDIENILYKVIVDVKVEKELGYADDIISLVTQLKKLEAEKKQTAQDTLIIDETKEEK